MKSIALVAALAAGLASVPLAAAELSHKATTVMERVKTSDLDLSSAEGLEKLEKRMVSAKQRVCRRNDRGQIVSAGEERTCIAALDEELSVELVAEHARKTDRQG